MFRYAIRFILSLLIILGVGFGLWQLRSVIYLQYNVNLWAHYITKGPFAYVESQLAGQPVAKWSHVINTIEPAMPHRSLSIVPYQTLPLSQAEKVKLLAGETIALFTGPKRSHIIAIKRISNTAYAFHLPLNHSYETVIEKNSGWLIGTLLRQIKATPPSQWQEKAKQLSRMYDMPIHIIDTLPTGLDQTNRNLLTQHQESYIKIDADIRGIIYYGIPGTHYYLKIGPAGSPKRILFLVITGIVFFITLLLFMLVWTYPFYRNVRKLARLANDYSHGKFNSDVKIKKLATLYPLYRDLTAMGNAINTLIESHKQLTNAVSHELRSPLARIRFASEMAAPSKRPENYLTEINNSVEELNSLIEELLTYTRFDRQQTIDCKPHQLKKWIAGIIETERALPTAQRCQIKLECNIKTGKQQAAFDEKLMTRALRNLISNALRYTKSTILVSLQSTDTNVLITVEDDGPGIPENERDKIFDPFYRVDNSRTKATGGYGLGLAIVKNIIKLHHAEIDVTYSAALGGAKFIITLPRHPHDKT